MPNNELQELLSARFEAHTHPTNEGVWNTIEAQLDTEQSDRAGIWFWVFNGIAATLLLGLMFQSGFHSTLPAKSTNIQLTKETLKESPSPEANNSNPSENGTTAEATANHKTEQNSILGNGENQEEVFNNQVGKSTRASEMNSTGSNIEQFVSLPEVSTHTDEGFIVTRTTRAKNLSVDDLSTRLLTYPIGTGTIENSIPGIAIASKKRLPIHLGAEFTYLRRTRNSVDAIAALNSGYTQTNEQLANNRHFEFSLFAQFDLTRRFSVATGVGYTQSKTSSSSGVTGISASSYSPPLESELKLITVPIQTKFTFLQRNRFGLSAGLTFQGEFGRIRHTEVADAIESSTTNPPQSITELDQSLVYNELKIRQFTFEPNLRCAISLTPRISSFVSVGYRMYLNQSDKKVATYNRLNYFHSDIGVLFRLR